MAEEDIYNNKRRYQRRVQQFEELTKPIPGGQILGRRRYSCQNKDNIRYFRTLHLRFEGSDLSYARRNRYLDTLLFLTHHTPKDLADCGRDDIDALVAAGHAVNRSIESKTSFLKDLKRIWRLLFPELDERGRADERLVPYVVRHVSCRIDKSRQRLRDDRLTLDDYERIVAFFNSDAEMQAYITLAVESLGRPQEICYTRIKDLELHENYACLWVSSHGKEGTKFLQCIDCYPYLMRWFMQHGFQSDPEAFLFYARDERDRPLTPANINKKLRYACKKLGLKQRITAYSLKRNGVTFSRLRGDTDLEIQHRAGWTSTRQINTYDLSTAKDAFQVRLEKLGLAENKHDPQIETRQKTCVCGHLLGFTDRICFKCKRSSDGKQVKEDSRAESEIRGVLMAALKDPNRSFAEILKECRVG